MTENSLHNKGDLVEKPGDYVCVPCGYRKHYETGDTFGECISCLAGTDEGHEDYVAGMEMWEHAPAKPGGKDDAQKA